MERARAAIHVVENAEFHCASPCRQRYNPGIDDDSQIECSGRME
jgi:hypothetical protein